MPFRVTIKFSRGHVASQVVLSKVLEDGSLGPGLSCSVDYLFRDDKPGMLPSNLVTFVKFIKENKCEADPEDPWEILTQLFPDNAKEIEALIIAESQETIRAAANMPSQQRDDFKPFDDED